MIIIANQHKIYIRLSITVVGIESAGDCAKKLKFNHTNKWYIYNPKFVLENETRKTLWDFEMRTDPLISARRPTIDIIKKIKMRTHRIVDFATERK